MFLDIKKPKIGFVWNSNRDAYIGRFKRIDLEELLSGIHSDKFEWISLYVESSEKDLEALNKYGVRSYDSELTNFSDTAALIDNLDLVITIDTAVAHLAGGLGVKTWLLLPNYAVDWRWLLEREDSPWYPTVRLFRQQSMGEWGGVLEGIREELSLI